MKRLNEKHAQDTHPAVIAHMTARCGHCQQTTTQSIRWCGHARVCAQCDSCGWHRRIGGRLATLTVLSSQHRRPA